MKKLNPNLNWNTVPKTRIKRFQRKNVASGFREVFEGNLKHEFTDICNSVFERGELLATKFLKRNPNFFLGEIDLVCSGGALKGWFQTGAWSVLYHLVKEGRVSIKRFSGSSAGAQSAFCIAMNLHPSLWTRIYFAWQLCQQQALNENKLKIIPPLEVLFPSYFDFLIHPKAHQDLRGRLHISLTSLKPIPKPWIVSDYSSRDDLLQALYTTCFIPLLFDDRKPVRYFRDVPVIDGAITNLVPTFKDKKRDQLVINMFRHPYPLEYYFWFKDPDINTNLIIPGQNEMIKALENKTGKRDCIYFINGS